MTYLVFDLETQNHKSHKRVANPFDPRNYVVMRGWKVEGDVSGSMSYHKSRGAAGPVGDNYLHIPHQVDLLVGFNIKFDLLYEMVCNYASLNAFYKRGGRVWCCQYAEYLLRGQRRKYHMCSLDQIIESYGGRKKIDGVKELWEAGVLTADIDPEMLKDYLIGTEQEGRNSGDIGNTELIYLGQIEEAKSLGMYEGILARMDGLCCTTEMEFNGIKVSMETATRNMSSCLLRKAQAEKELATYTNTIPAEVGFSWTSGIHKSCIIFGGRIKYQKPAHYIDDKTGEDARLVSSVLWPVFEGFVIDPDQCTWSRSRDLWAMQVWDDDFDGVVNTMRWIPQDIYVGGKKKGEGKFRKVKAWGEKKSRIQDFFYDLEGYTKPLEEWKTALVDGAGRNTYSTGADVVETLAKKDIPFLKVMGRFNALSKEIGTYYVVEKPNGELKGMLTCVDDQQVVHHKLNHSSTVTTRLSSSDPNMQNIPRADYDPDLEDVKSRVKEMFESRFSDGEMGELDYSQLEVVVQGLLSKDKHLCRDLNNKIDFHCKRVALKNSCTYEFAIEHCKNEDAPKHHFWKKERTGCKIFSFQRAYGAGASTISDETGISVTEIKAMIALEEKEYPGVVKFNAAVEKAVSLSAEWFADGERGWRKFRRGEWQSPTGTIYEFRSWPAPKFLRDQGVMESFSPPEMKNYPVQGTGGEVVQIALGKLWRMFVATDNFGGKALLVNTVHDCVWVDMANGVAHLVLPAMKTIMEAIPFYLKEIFNLNCPVPFPVDAEHGPNMLDLHKFKPT